MPKNKDKGHREARKEPIEFPAVNRFGNLSMPRKNNRAAAKYVASKDPFWDRRLVARKARKNALALQRMCDENPRRQHLSKPLRLRLLAELTTWTFDHKRDAFVYLGVPPDRATYLAPETSAPETAGGTLGASPGRTASMGSPARQGDQGHLRMSVPTVRPGPPRCDELLAAARVLGTEPCVLKLVDLTHPEIRHLRRYLPDNVTLVAL